jgi:hypothetical protein
MSFGSDIDKFADKAEARLLLATRKIALEAFSEVILMSPVDKGRFRGNWQVSINQMPIGTVDLEDPSGQSAISAVNDMVAKLNNFEAIYLVNNLPYARRLEYGWSKQAPGGMVRITAQRWQPIVNQVVAQINSGSFGG